MEEQKQKLLPQNISNMKGVFFLLILTFISCSVKRELSCDKSSFRLLKVEDITINNNDLKELSEYNIRLYQFSTELNLKDFKLCYLKRNNFEILGEFNNQNNPQRAYIKISKRDNDSLFLLVYDKGYVFPLNKMYNHYSLYLDDKGNVESLNAHKEEFIYYE